MTYTIDITHEPKALENIREEWNTLHERSYNHSIFMTWEYIATWWEHLGHDHMLWLMTARDKQGKLVGIAPMMRVRRTRVKFMAWHQLEFIGATTNSDHTDFIIEIGLEKEIIPAFIHALNHQTSNNWDVIALSSIPADSPSITALHRIDLDWEQAKTSICPYIPLGETDWDTHFASLSKRKRKEVRRKYRDLEAAYGDNWQYHIIDKVEDIRPTMEAMMAMHQEKWDAIEHHDGAFANQQIANFHLAVAERLFHRGRLRLQTLHIDGELAAVLYNFIHHNHVFDFASGLNAKFAEISAGQILTAESLRNAIETGVEEYDFLRGEEDYKFRWGAQERINYAVRHIGRDHIYLYDGLIDIMRFGKRLMKSTRSRNVDTEPPSA